MGITGLATLTAFLVAYLYPRSPMTIARESDARMHLRARLATAVEIQGQLEASPRALPIRNGSAEPSPRSVGRRTVAHTERFRRAVAARRGARQLQRGLISAPEIATRQLADACAAAGRANPRQAFKPHFPRRQAAVAATLLALLIGSFVVPNPQEARIAQQQAEQRAIEEQIARIEEQMARIEEQTERLEALREEIAANESLSQEDKEDLLRELDDTLGDLQESELGKAEAVARLSEAEGKLKKLLSEDTEALESALREAGYKASQDDSTQDIGRSLSQGEYADAAQAMESLGEQLSSDAAELESTAQRLEAMAAALVDSRPELAQALRDAAEAIRRRDVDAARKALQRASELTRQVGQEIAAQQATEQALGQIQESRRAIAQAGQGQQGQGQQPQGSGSGHGDSDSEGGQGTPGSPGGPIPPNQPGQSGQTPYDPVYAPERLGGEDGERVDLPGQDQGGPDTGETVRHTLDEGRALVPYDEVYTEYREQATSALENSYIPRGLKEYVRTYFSSLEPRE